MKYSEYFTPVNLVLGAVGLSIVLIGASCIQTSCQKKHETNAAYSGAVADTHAKELADLKQQLAGKETEIASVKDQALDWKKKFEKAKSKAALPPLPAPVGETELAASLVAIGMGDATQVQIAVPSILNVSDATLVFNLDQEAKRAKALDEALITCAQAVTASEAVVKAQDEGLKLSSNALHVSQAEAAARQTQVNELAKSLKIEKQKKWKLVAYPIAAAALTAWVVKK